MNHHLNKLVLGGGMLCSIPLFAQTPPNIVLFFVDDMGYGDLTLTGASGYQTPVLDKMAGEGMYFTHFYAAQPVSTASRAGLLTGCYPNRIGLPGALMPQSKLGLNPEETTIAELLKSVGYACGMVGKWHLGHHHPFLPLQNGFDMFLGLPYSNDMWPVDYEGRRVTPESNLPNKLRHPALPLIDGNEKVRELWTLQDQGELTTLYTERAVEYIKANKENPFFLYVAHSMPHVPLAVSEKFKGESEQGLYGDVMMEIDWSVGQILSTLQSLGLDDNTLVIFTSDNGPWLNFGNHAGSNAGFREGKGTSFEGGQRVPCIMRWEGVIPAGTVCNQLASTLDILPTLAGITGASLPDRIIDGVNISSLIKGEAQVNPREHLYYYYGRNNLNAVRDKRFKLVLPHKHQTYSIPGNDGFPGRVSQAEAGLALYDLRRDPGETLDVKELYPEVVARLMAIAEQARDDLGDDNTGRTGKHNRPPGSVD